MAVALPAVVFAVGGRVTHDAHGMGRVLSVSPSAVRVDFGGPKPVSVKVPTTKMAPL